MNHVEVKSSNIKSIAYSGNEMRIRFQCGPCKSTGKSGIFDKDITTNKLVERPCAKCDGLGHTEYGYPDVPAETHAAFMKAESPGKYFAANIRGKFEGKRI